MALTSNIDLSNTCYFQIASDDLNDYRILYDGGLDFHVNHFFAFVQAEFFEKRVKRI